MAKEKTKKKADKPRKKTRRAAKKKIAIATDPREEIKEKKYIIINQNDQNIEAKYRLVWIITGVLSVFLLIFWLWTLKYNVTKANQNLTIDPELREEINQVVDNFKNNMRGIKEIFNADDQKIIERQQLAMIKEQVIRQIQLDLDSANWPTHRSEIMGFSIQYPANWYKKEMATFSLTTYPEPATSTPAVLAKIIISRKEKSENTTFNQWLASQNLTEQNYQTAALNFNLPNIEQAVKFQKINTAADDLNWLVYLSNLGQIYEINIYARNGADLYENIINKIIATIKFIP